MLLCHCANEPPSVEGSRKLSELNVTECDALSTWMLDLADERLPALGSPIVCDGARRAVQWTVTPTCPAHRECPATVAEFRRCAPAVFDMMRRRYCMFAQSSAVFMEAILALPECTGAAMCGQGSSNAPALLRL
jgi:hypothetical protein